MTPLVEKLDLAALYYSEGNKLFKVVANKIKDGKETDYKLLIDRCRSIAEVGYHYVRVFTALSRIHKNLTLPLQFSSVAVALDTLHSLIQYPYLLLQMQAELRQMHVTLIRFPALPKKDKLADSIEKAGSTAAGLINYTYKVISSSVAALLAMDEYRNDPKTSKVSQLFELFHQQVEQLTDRKLPCLYGADQPDPSVPEVRVFCYVQVSLSSTSNFTIQPYNLTCFPVPNGNSEMGFGVGGSIFPHVHTVTHLTVRYEAAFTSLDCLPFMITSVMHSNSYLPDMWYDRYLEQKASLGQSVITWIAHQLVITTRIDTAGIKPLLRLVLGILTFPRQQPVPKSVASIKKASTLLGEVKVISLDLYTLFRSLGNFVTHEPCYEHMLVERVICLMDIFESKVGNTMGAAKKTQETLLRTTKNVAKVIKTLKDHQNGV